MIPYIARVHLGYKDHLNNEGERSLTFIYGVDELVHLTTDAQITAIKTRLDDDVCAFCQNGDGANLLSNANPIAIEIAKLFLDPADFSHVSDFEYGELPNNPPNDIQLVSTVRKRIGRYRDSLDTVMYFNTPEPINTSEGLEGETGIFPVLTGAVAAAGLDLYTKKGKWNLFEVLEALNSNYYVGRPKKSK